MLKRLIDIVMQLTELNEKRRGSLREAASELLLKGYSQQEVDQAIEWIYAKRDLGQSRPRLAGKYGLRIMSEWERMNLNNEAQDYIFKLMNLGIVDEFMLDRIIIQAASSYISGQSVEDVKEIASSVILSEYSSESELSGLENMEDGGTIN